MRAPAHSVTLPQEQITTDETLSFPFDVDPLRLLRDEDDMVFQEQDMEPSTNYFGEEPEPFTDEEMDSFLSDLNINKGIYLENLDDFDDDDEFGNLLERVISC